MLSVPQQLRSPGRPLAGPLTPLEPLCLDLQVAEMTSCWSPRDLLARYPGLTPVGLPANHGLSPTDPLGLLFFFFFYILFIYF